MKQHSVRKLLSFFICIFVLVSLFSVFALAENELETVELEIPNPAPEFPTLWVQAVAPDNSVVSNLLLELVLPGGEVAASLVTVPSAQCCRQFRLWPCCACCRCHGLRIPRERCRSVKHGLQP